MSIQPTDHDGNSLPAETAFSRIVEQRHLDECHRALGRPLLAFEFKILEDMMLLVNKQNRKATRNFEINKIHSVDELVSIFVERVQKKDVREIADKIMREADRKQDIEAKLADVANRT